MHFTPFVVRGTPTSDSLEIIKEISWKNKSVLDVGCGTGLFAYRVAKKGAKVLGIDYADEAIDIANKTHVHTFKGFFISFFDRGRGCQYFKL